MRELLNALSRYLICSPGGKCFQRILIKLFKERLITVQKFFLKNIQTYGYVVYILDCWAVPGYSILKTVPAIRDSNMLRLGEFVHYKTKPVQNCLAFANNHQMFQGIFLDILKTDSLRHAGEMLHVKTVRIHQNTQGRRLSLSQTKGNVLNRLRFLKKHFMFLEELNRRIRENGIN